MSTYTFHVIEHGSDRRPKRSSFEPFTREFPDREAAHMFALDVPAQLLEKMPQTDDSRHGLLAISNEGGEVLDTLHSVRVLAAGESLAFPQGWTADDWTWSSG